MKKIALIIALAVITTQSSIATGQNSYIIVHAHNPEGIEIASIQGVGQGSVTIYDGDTFIGYGAYNAGTHYKPIAISSGAHTIKAKFNGMTMAQDIDIVGGTIQVLTFTFTRTEFDILSVMRKLSGSIRMTYEYNFPITINTPPIPEGLFMKDMYLDCRGTGSISSDMWLEYDGLNFNHGADCVYSGNSQIIDLAWICFNPNDDGIYTEPNLIPAHTDFLNWYGQYVSVGLYPAVRVGSYTHAGVIVAGGESSGTQSFSAGVTYTKMFIDNMTSGLSVSVYGISGSQHWNRSGSLTDVAMSSVPYDLLGTGVKDEGNQYQLPVASFTYSPENPLVGEEITFDASASYDPDGTIVSYEWGFGDGQYGQEQVTSHSYSSDGEYLVSLIVSELSHFLNCYEKL